MLLRRTAIVGSLLVVSMTVGGCSEDDLFSNLNGTHAANSTPRSGAGQLSPDADALPNYGDNSSARRPRPMSATDEREALDKAKALRPVLEAQRKRGRVAPRDLRPVLEKLGAGRVTIAERAAATSAAAAKGSTFGVFVGRTACLTGAVTEERVYLQVDGPFPDTGCLEPPVAH
ncbi:hypothetical protein [Streptomyces sp. NPDC048410]|uniref:hypothetical protein n=1 Tax=Streptomyces sp. NPDC048410 TaxID=3365545 RepID=UPI003714A00A